MVVSVGYRRAPEAPFPAAVDDGVDALLYLSRHAPELGLDVSRVVLSGFSAGGNLTVTVPLPPGTRSKDLVVVMERKKLKVSGVVIARASRLTCR